MAAATPNTVALTKALCESGGTKACAFAAHVEHARWFPTRKYSPGSGRWQKAQAGPGAGSPSYWAWVKLNGGVDIWRQGITRGALLPNQSYSPWVPVAAGASTTAPGIMWLMGSLSRGAVLRTVKTSTSLRLAFLRVLLAGSAEGDEELVFNGNNNTLRKDIDPRS